MDRLKELREKMAKLVTEARECLDEATSADEARAAELENRHDAIMKDHDKLEADYRRAERLAEAEARAAERAAAPDPRRPNGEDRETPGQGEQATPDLADVFTRAMVFGSEYLDAEERKLVAQIRANLPNEVRAQAVATGAAGGYTVPEGFLAEITRAMALFGPMLDPGVTRVINTDSGNNLPWPTNDDTGNEGELLGENTAAAENADVVFGQKSLGAFTFSSKLVRVSLAFLQDSAFDINGLLRDIFAERIGRGANRFLTTGTGSGQPEGIVTGSGLGMTAAINNAITGDELIDMQHSVDAAYRKSPSVRWMFHDSTLAAIRKLKDGQGNYLWQPRDVKSGAPAELLSHPYEINNAMPVIAAQAKPIVFGDFSKYIVRRVTEFTLMRLNERYAEMLQAGFLGFNRIDGILADTNAVKHLAMPV